MFEQLRISQPQVADELENDFIHDRVSRSSLFCGPQYSSRMTAALSLAKQLSCRGDGSDNCTCPSCRNFKYYSMNNVVVVANRNYTVRYNCAVETYLRLRNAFSQANLIRTVRLLLLSYHQALSTDKLSKLYESAKEVDEYLLELSRSPADLSEIKAKRLVSHLNKAMKPLLKQDSKNLINLSVDSVRQIRAWTSSTMIESKCRIIIIESIEKANDSVRNSLLKMLEEPEENVYFILISERPGQIIKTILSRTRKFNFPPLSQEIQNKILQPFFLEKPMSIASFFMQYAVKGGLDEVNNTVQLFFDSAVGKQKRLDAKQLSGVTKVLDDAQVDEYVMDFLVKCIKNGVSEGFLSHSRAHALVLLLDQSFLSSTIYNITRRNMWEAIYMKLSEVQDG